MLWVPYIIFKNTDSDEAVTVDGDIRTIVAVTREGEFVRSGPEVVDEVLYREFSRQNLDTRMPRESTLNVMNFIDA